MADRYAGALKKIWRQRRKEMSIFGNTDASLDDLTVQMQGKKISAQDYLLLLTLVYDKYQRQGYSMASRQYIVMRMQSVQWAIGHKEFQKQYPFIADWSQADDGLVEHFLERKRPYFRQVHDHMVRLVVIAICILYALLLSLLVFGFHGGFWTSVAVSLLVAALSAVYCWQTLLPALCEEMLKRSSKDLDGILFEFEQHSVRGGLPWRRQAN